MKILNKFKKLVQVLNKLKSEKLKDRMMQQQVSGNDSMQTQIGTMIYNLGITEERTRNIFNEMFPTAFEHAGESAISKINELDNAILKRIEKEKQISGDLENIKKAFEDPRFQIVFKNARYAAIQTERPDDYELLSELLLCHIQKGNERINRAGIKKAIEIVPDVDNNALCGLTISHAIGMYYPVSGYVDQGLHRLDDLFSALLFTELPTGSDWIDLLDTLGALRINPVGAFKKFSEYYYESLNGYVCVGIEIGSDEHRQAIELIDKIGLPTNAILVRNDLIDGYARLCVPNKAQINNVLYSSSSSQKRKLNNEEIRVLEKVWTLYSKDSNKLNIVKNEFIKRWDSCESLRKIRIWWENIPNCFDITMVGMVLAHVNAKRCDSTLPDLLKDER